MIIQLRNITGFKNNAPNEVPVIILDKGYRPFYDSRILNNPVEKFNLPPGKYFVQSGEFSELKKPVQYKLAKLPPAERRLKNPLKFKIVWGENPHKCTIFWNANKILFDNGLKKLSLPSLYFILFHEYGHAKYSTEKYCDLFAANLMLLNGFNPSQIGTAPIHSLSEKQGERKQFIVDQLLKLNK